MIHPTHPRNCSFITSVRTKVLYNDYSKQIRYLFEFYSWVFFL